MPLTWVKTGIRFPRFRWSVCPADLLRSGLQLLKLLSVEKLFSVEQVNQLRRLIRRFRNEFLDGGRKLILGQVR